MSDPQSNVRTEGNFGQQLAVGKQCGGLGRGIGQQSSRSEQVQQKIVENPAWIERQRLRRLYQAVSTFRRTRSLFLIDWVEKELMMIVRDA